MSILKKLKDIYLKNKVIFENFSFITLLQIFLMIIPLITYPYLIRVLGSELYGIVITAQIVASYCSVIVDFGFKSVSARHVSIYRDDRQMLSEIMSSILVTRLILWGGAFVIFLGVIYGVDSYRQHFWLFLFSYGLTFNELLFPQFFFQGIERMKSIVVINILIRSIFIILIFIFVTEKKDYIFVPLFSSIGYFIGGIVSLYIIVKKYHISFVKPDIVKMKYYVKDALPIVYTDVICTVKDKLSYIFIGQLIGMSEVTIYDLGAKLVRILAKPSGIIATVLFPKIAKKKDIKLFNQGLLISLGVTLFLVLGTNLFLDYIVRFFMNESIDLLPIRLFLIVPVVLAVSGFIASNLMIALGYNKYILYSIIVTTIGYCSSLAIFYYMDYMTVTSMVLVALIAYLAEFVYRLLKSNKIIKNERKVK
ncbi:oligosaccharide flippase family protein [Marinifilum breve]|nr:oligosaccharide flippase family protein [Marinifilum breve]